MISKIKLKLLLLKESFCWGLHIGIRYWKDASYRRGVKNNQKNRKKYGNSFEKNKKSLRKVVTLRDGSRCNWCRKELLEIEMTLDHVTPVSHGGTNKAKNLQILCNSCHIIKTKQERGDFNGLMKESSEEFNKPFLKAFKEINM